MTHLRRLRTPLLVPLLGLAVALASLLPATSALAAENSWRYKDGVGILSLPDDDSPDDASALATSSHWVQSGNTWSTTYRGRHTTVNALAFGVDVSFWNGSIDWAAAKRDGVQFAILRCASGRNPRNDDSQFVANVRGCKENGIPFGVYLYSYASSVGMANEEADHALRMLSEAGAAPGDVAYPVYYDLEENSLASTRNRLLLASMAETFCTRLEQAGYQPGVYANRWWWSEFLTEPVFDRWERWIADWNPSGLNAGLTFDRPFGLWQSMAQGWVDGIGTVDIDFDFRTRPTNNPEIPAGDIVPGAVYRMYNYANGEHLLTADLNEARTLRERGWRYEKREWIEPSGSGVPIYRLYNPNTGEHLYTNDENEYDQLCQWGWTGEGVKLHGADETGVPVYRLRNPYEDGPKSHHFTASANERAELERRGWVSEGIAWYGLR